MKKKIKVTEIIICVIIMLMLWFCKCNEVYAWGVSDLGGTPVENSGMKSVANQVITILTVIGSSVSVIVLIVIGIKYMFGSLEERAEYKKSMQPYVIGAALVFAASTIAGTIFRLISNM